MKWVGLILSLVLCGIAVYFIFFTKDPTPGSPQAVAHAYVDAAVAGDTEKIRSLATGPGVQDALRLAPQVRSIVSGGNAMYQPTTADPPRRGVTVLVGTRMIGIELVDVDGAWRIILVRISDM